MSAVPAKGKRKLVIFGDSYVEGYFSTPEGDFRVEKNFCDWLEESLDIEVENFGVRGHCNVAISYDIMSYIRTRDIRDTAFLVVWSEVSRNFMMDPKRENSLDEFGRVMGIRRISDLINLPEFQDEGIKRYQTEMSYHGTINILNEAKIPFLMTNSICNQMFKPYRIKFEPKENGFNKGIGIIEDYQFLFHPKVLKDVWIEGGLPNNTLVDIIIDRWLSEEQDQHYYMKLSHLSNTLNQYDTLTNDLHPNEKGHELIAKTLEPYIRRII